MADLANLKGYLAHAETSITEGELRLTRQVVQVELLRTAGRDIWQAHILLGQLQEILERARKTQTEILASIAQLEAANTPLETGSADTRSAEPTT